MAVVSKQSLVHSSVKQTAELFGEIFCELSEGKLKNIRKALNDVYAKKFNRSHGVKYGNINRGFTKSELERFFNYILLPDEEKYYIAFLMQAYLGLRVGEVVKVRLEDINFAEKRIRIDTEKSRKIDWLYLHDRVRLPLENWVRKSHNLIEKKAGYVLFSLNPKQIRDHLSAGHLRIKFREIAKRAGLTEWYCESDERHNKRYSIGNRKLFRLTTHSLRHFYITQVYHSTLDPVTTSKLARHTDLKSTQVYIHTNEETLEEGMKKTFEE